MLASKYGSVKIDPLIVSTGQDSIRWILWISLCDTDVTAAVCREISPLPL